MAASSAYSRHYSSANVPANGRPIVRNTGDVDDFVTYTVATTSLDDAGDVVYLIPVQSGRTIGYLVFDCAALAASSLDLDIILRTTNSAGTHTDTILYNAGTAFTSAHSGKVVVCNVAVPEDADSVGHICLYCNVAGTTPAAGAITLNAKVY